MAGQIIKRGEDSWTVRIFLGRDLNGKRKYFNKTVHGKKKDAQKYLTAKMREKDLGILVEPSNMPLSEFIDKWLRNSVKNRVTEATFDSYETMVRLHIKPNLGDRRLCDIQKLDVQELCTKLFENGFSRRTVQYVRSILSMVMKEAVEGNLLIKNPCQSVILPEKKTKEMRAFSMVEAKRFVEALQDDPNGIILEFALNTGMRPEEYLGLQWSDVDFDVGTVKVQRALVWRKGGGWIFQQPKTKSSKRTIPIPLPLLARLKKYKVKQSTQRLKLGKAYENNNLVFATEIGTPVYYGNLTKRHFKPALKRASISETFRLYDLRHSCATLLLANGVNVKVIQERLGHANIKMTLETYSHVLPGMQESATKQMSKMLYG